MPSLCFCISLISFGLCKFILCIGKFFCFFLGEFLLCLQFSNSCCQPLNLRICIINYFIILSKLLIHGFSAFRTNCQRYKYTPLISIFYPILQKIKSVVIRNFVFFRILHRCSFCKLFPLSFLKIDTFNIFLIHITEHLCHF